MSENETEAAQAWDKIEAGHGLVAVDPEWATAHDWPPTMRHPKDSSKVVYVIEAYHEIHCLVSPNPRNVCPSKSNTSTHEG